MTTNNSRERANLIAKELAMDSAHIPIIESVLISHLEILEMQSRIDELEKATKLIIPDGNPFIALDRMQSRIADLKLLRKESDERE